MRITEFNLELIGEEKRENYLEQEVFFQYKGQNYTAVVDVFAEYENVMWYADEFGSEYELQLESVEADVLEIYDNEDNLVDYFTKEEIKQLENLITKTL